MSNRWANNGNSDRLYFLRLWKWLWMVTAAMKLKDACSLEEKLCKPRQHIKKQRRYFADKGPSSQSYGFYSRHIWTWELERKQSVEELMLLNCGVGGLLRVPWTSRRSNQSILKEISPEYLLERLMLKLKLQYFSHQIWRTDSLEKVLMLGKIEGGRRRGW